MFCNVTETFYVSHADFKHFVTFCKRLSSDSVILGGNPKTYFAAKS